MDTKDTVEAIGPGAAPAKPLLKPEPPLPELHSEERTDREAAHEHESVSAVLLRGIGVKDMSLDFTASGAAFDGLSVATPEGKEKEKPEKEDYMMQRTTLKGSLHTL